MSSSRSLLRLLIACGASASVLVGPTAISAQSVTVRVEEIRLDPQAHVDEVRTITGVVDRLVDRGASSTSAFYVEDDYGHMILVVSSEPAPARGSRLTLTGVVSLDDSGDPMITMVSSSAASAATTPRPDAAGAAGAGDAVDPAAAGAESDPCLMTLSGEAVDPEACAAATSPPIGLLVGATLLLLVLTGGVFVARRGVPAPFAPEAVELPTSALWGPPISDREYVGGTLRFVRPDPGTLQLMPGRLEVTGGEDAGQVIRLVRVPGAEVEMTFGRAANEGPSHVQFKEQTVSRQHAKIRLRDGEWWLQNYSRTNPTVLNGEPLAATEVPLSDHDSIEMGEVTFRFRAS